MEDRQIKEVGKGHYKNEVTHHQVLLGAGLNKCRNTEMGNRQFLLPRFKKLWFGIIILSRTNVK